MRFSWLDRAAASSKADLREPDTIETSPRTAASHSAPLGASLLARPHGISRVPTHAVGRARERREYPRARLALPLHVERVAGQRSSIGTPLRTRNISSSGLYYLSPQRIEPGTPIEIEILLVDRPLGRGSVRMRTEAHVVRVDDTEKPGWHGLAATFDEITFRRDEAAPIRRMPSKG
jgi:hypothetical protein